LWVFSMSRNELLHATYANKARAIQMVGLRVGSLTKRGTGYKKAGEFDYLRDKTYRESERVIEETRPEGIPSRKNAVFLFPRWGSAYGDEPDAFIVGEDEWGRPVYDFGFGKDTIFVVDGRMIPCRCGVGDMVKSDEVFRCEGERTGMIRLKEPYVSRSGGLRLRYGAEKPPSEESCKRLAEEFWEDAESFDPRTDDLDDILWKENGECKWEDPEVWCPCSIPREALIEKWDSRHPAPQPSYGGG